MDQDGSLAISFDEWRDFLLYAPSTDIIEIIHYWRHSTVSLEICCCLCNYRHVSLLRLLVCYVYSLLQPVTAGPLWWHKMCLMLE